MKTILIAAALLVTIFADAALAEPDPAVLAYKLPGQIAWRGDPVKGPLTYPLWGDPTRPGPYAILVKWPAHQMSRPHTHPNARYIYVITGVWWVGTGETFAPETTTPIPAGSFVTHFAKQFHYDGAKDQPAVLEIVGEGPQ
ncbi:MAG: cupin domain-containing protein [Phenylobacterium sp.]